MNRTGRLFSVWNAVFLLAVIVLVLLVVYPMYSIFQASLISADTGGFTWDNYLSVFTTRFYRRCLWNSIFLSGLATVFSVIIGVPFAFLTTRYRLPHASILKTLGTLPLILPTFIGAEAWLLLLGRNGILTQLFHSMGLHTPSIYGWQGVVVVTRALLPDQVFPLCLSHGGRGDQFRGSLAGGVGPQPRSLPVAGIPHGDAAGRHARHCLRRAHRVLHVH